MPRDFNSFINEQKNSNNEAKVNEYKEIIDKYKDLSSNDLMSNLMNEATKLKNEGKLNQAMLENLKGTLSPFLNEEQKNMLNGLVSKINEQ